ncbi:MAG: GNAT family N-acetyltransferase [Methanomassiliicoccales archaeon]|nr:GNAT family N-acetyltransferase [Methanomassiliicoccales archaeon]
MSFRYFPCMERPNVEIVPVTPENVGALVGLIMELAKFEELTPPSLEAQERLRRDATTTPPRFQAFLAYMDGDVVGYIAFFYTYSTLMAAPTLFLEDIYVKESFRRTGVGRKLFSYCLKEALDHGCERMEWTALNWNVKAMEFYERCGGAKMGWTLFRMDRERMRRSLEEV